MNVEQLIAAAEGCQWVGSRLAELPERREQAVHASILCSMASMILSELAEHLTAGVEPYEARLKTAAGELTLPPGAAILLKVLVTKAESDDDAPRPAAPTQK